MGKAMASARAIGEYSAAVGKVAGAGGRVSAGGFGAGGMPGGAGLPSALSVGSPLSVFQYTLSRADRIAMFRYFMRTDPFVGRAIELHSELPLSRLAIGPPKGPNSQQNREVTRIYENMVQRIGLLEFLLEMAREYWAVGDVYIWHEWDDEIKEWSELYILPVEYCHSVLHPFVRKKELVIFARPLVDTASIRRMNDRDLYMLAGDPDVQELMEEVEDDLPEGLKDLLNFGEGHPLNTDPEKGSFVFHLSRNRPPNETYGQGIIERCLESLLRLENLKNAQMQITGRNMQPKHLIWGEGIGPNELADLRSQVDLAILDNVDYPIVTNYPVHWEIIGAQQRLLNVEGEYTNLYEALATGLCTTREMLTGAATYGGQRITLELMNTQYLTFRQLVQEYVHSCIFRPVAEAKGHYYYEEVDTWIAVNPEDLEAGDDVIQEYDGALRKRRIQINKIYNHSQLRFNRLSIRDNAEVYDQLFQLHQKGSLALRYLLDIHNIDPEENAAALLEDLMTVRDPVFNRLLEGIYGALATPLIEKTDIVNRVIEGLNLDLQSEVAGEPSPGAPPESAGLGGGMAGADISAPVGDDMGDLGMEADMGAEGASGMPPAEGAAPPMDSGLNPTASGRRTKKKVPYSLSGIRLSRAQVKGLKQEANKGINLSFDKVKAITAALNEGNSSKKVKNKPNQKIKQGRI